MKRCSKCGQPMVASGDVCSRLTCSTQEFNSQYAEESGKNGRREIQPPTRSEIGQVVDFTEPAAKSIALYAMQHADAASVMASEISGHRFTYTTGRSGRFWPNAEDTHVNYRGKTVGGII